MKRKLGLAALALIVLLLATAAIIGALGPSSRIIVHEPGTRQPATSQPTRNR